MRRVTCLAATAVLPAHLVPAPAAGPARHRTLSAEYGNGAGLR